MHNDLIYPSFICSFNAPGFAVLKMAVHSDNQKGENTGGGGGGGGGSTVAPGNDATSGQTQTSIWTATQPKKDAHIVIFI